MSRLLAALTIDSGWQPLVIHVAGTNGKGSTCACLDAISRAAGLKTGLFTSPHLISYRERVKVDGQMIASEELEQRIFRLRAIVATWEPHPTFFELTTALAWQYFHDQGCDAVILETGMGGRLDATTAIAAHYAVITPIAFDHMAWLGHTMEAIAAEKAGIIQAGQRAVITAPQAPEALHIIRETAQKHGLRLLVVDKPVPAAACALSGEHQRWNAAVAAGAALAADFSREAILKGLASVSWPGRFQRLKPIGESNEVILDGAHNAHGITALVNTWREIFGEEKATIIFGAVEGKQAEEALVLLQPIARQFLFTQPNSPRAVPAESLADIVSNAGHFPTLSQAWQASQALPPGPRLICGSLYLVGEALALLQSGENDFEPSRQ